MRALTRMRSLAAACALLLVVAGTAAAGAPGRPIDRPDSPPPQPAEVGDPDQPPNMFPVLIAGRIYLFRLPAFMMRTLLRPATGANSNSAVVSTRGARHGH